ncbi:hypothetical protein E4U43_001953 [Claviceps pusilla]|uniref:Early meiotic induction protein 1 n=1 Tax=Claviceps pusilla TaxID=123648 RepID=A0A9P7NG52_9HYPO|nr:hypothetical protein E4U43_001953 [Claviceps pusilla]
MGWLWSSSSPPTPQEQPKAPSPDEQQASAPTEPVDPEIQKFLHLFQTDNGEQSTNSQSRSAPPPPTTAASPGTTTPPILSWLSIKASPKTNEADEAPLLDPLSESLLPTEMSCRQAFDLAWSCNGLGGQFNSVYRHGNMRSCSEHWDDFWFCMRTRAHSGPLKASMIRTHYRNKAYRKYGQDKPSSEDVWERRTEKLPPGSAFNIPIPLAETEERGDGQSSAKEEERRTAQEG